MIINNYRLISITPAISKVLEKIKSERFHSISDESILFYWKQFVFRSKRGTIDALAENRTSWAKDYWYNYRYFAWFA